MLLVIVAGLLLQACAVTPPPPPPAMPTDTRVSTETDAPATASANTPIVGFRIPDPIINPKPRITKKAFGTYVTPGDSPVSPEKFTGYHSGVDFETTPDEQSADISIFAICDGKITQKRSAQGYGGVLVQQCTIDNQSVTVIYGHLKLSSISQQVGDSLQAGKSFALLGNAYSTETDGERKHLHLGIKKEFSSSILGYVQEKARLDEWLDAANLLND